MIARFGLLLIMLSVAVVEGFAQEGVDIIWLPASRKKPISIPM